jgi:transposase-like protein
MVLEHRSEHESQWAAIMSIAATIGCTAETLRRWVRQKERDTGVCACLRGSIKPVMVERRLLQHASHTADQRLHPMFVPPLRSGGVLQSGPA